MLEHGEPVDRLPPEKFVRLPDDHFDPVCGDIEAYPALHAGTDFLAHFLIFIH